MRTVRSSALITDPSAGAAPIYPTTSYTTLLIPAMTAWPATIPAYLADIFGTRYVGGIHGRLLTAWSTTGVLGPLAITSLRQNSMNNAIDELMNTIDPAAFRAHFGASVDQLQLLVEQNTVTIARLMEIAPAGTIDPTSGLYNSTMVLMAGLLAIALVSNAMMRPVQAKHHIVD